jgi:hypothetical protein
VRAEARAAVNENRSRQKEQPAPTFYALAAEAMRANGGDTDAAEQTVFEQIQSDVSLLRAMIRDAVRIAASVSVTMVNGNKRAVVFDHAKQLADQRKAAEGTVRVIAASILDMPLADGTKLRDATRFEVVEAAERYRNLSSTMAHRARWLEAIAERVPDGRRIGDVLTDDAAQRIYEETAE